MQIFFFFMLFNIVYFFMIMICYDVYIQVLEYN